MSREDEKEVEVELDPVEIINSSHARKLLENFAETAIPKWFEEFSKGKDLSDKNVKLLFGKFVSKAYALGYIDGYEKRTLKKLYLPTTESKLIMS